MLSKNDAGQLVVQPRARIDGVLYPVTDAPESVTIKKTTMDVWRGVPGSATECMNAKCVMRNRKMFPHDVLAVSVTKSRVYILDSPNHAYRYALSKAESRAIDAHDREAMGTPGELTLRAPRASRPPQNRSPKRSTGTKRETTFTRGEQARVIAAVEGMN